MMIKIYGRSCKKKQPYSYISFNRQQYWLFGKGHIPCNAPGLAIFSSVYDDVKEIHIYVHMYAIIKSLVNYFQSSMNM